MQTHHLCVTQASLMPSGVPCSAIAVLVGNALLRTHASASTIEHCIRLGCSTWAMLTAPERGDKVPDAMLVAAQVLEDVVDAKTRIAPWTHELEISGLHLVAGTLVPAEMAQFLRATSVTAPGTLEFATVDSLPAALAMVATRSDASGRSLAVTITYAGHTIVVVYVRDHYGVVMHAVDSLRGEWLVADETSADALVARVTTAWCVPTANAADASFTANVFSRRAAGQN